MRRDRARRARRPVPRRRAAGRCRHEPQHEHERGHREPRARDLRTPARRLRLHPPQRRRQPFAIDERHLPRGVQARDLRRPDPARRICPAPARCVPQAGGQARERRDNRAHATAGRRADDLRAGIPRMGDVPQTRPAGDGRACGAIVRPQPRRDGHRHRHMRRPAVPRHGDAHTRPTHRPAGARRARPGGIGDRHERLHRRVRR